MNIRFNRLILLGILFFINCSDNRKIQLHKGAFPILYKGHLYIKGFADSIKGNFVFDTGASNLYLDSTYYYNNTFKHEDTFTAKLPGAGNSTQTVIVIQDTVQFSFGKNLYKTSIVPILQLKPILGDIADGILGMEYFYNSIVEINYKSRYMRVFNSIDSLNLKGYERIKVTKKNNRLYIPLKVNINDTTSIAGLYLLDFGSGGSISLTSKVKEKYKLDKSIHEKVAFYTKYRGVGGESFSYDFITKSVEIGSFNFKDVVIDYSLDTVGALASENHLGLIGNKIYERFHLYLDFVNNNLYLKPNKKYNKPFNAPRLGFSYVDRSQTLKYWIVTGLSKSSSAEKAGLKVDDKIMSVNGLAVTDIDYERQNSFFDEIDFVSLSVVRNQGSAIIKFKLKPILKIPSLTYK